jgi:hypothetical protein
MGTAGLPSTIAITATYATAFSAWIDWQKDFEREVDRDLDRNRRVNGSRREDQINREAHDFRNVVGNLKSAFGNGRDMSRSSDEAQRVLRQANVVERMLPRQFASSRLSSLWSQIRNELNVISDAYGYRGSIYRDDDYGRGPPRRQSQQRAVVAASPRISKLTSPT